MKKLLFLAAAAVMVLFTACKKEESNSIEGQWYCYENGGQDVRLYLELKDSKADLIITAWGDRYKGSYTYAEETGTLAINYTTYQARYVAGENPDKATSLSNLFNDWPGSTAADHVDLENPITMTFIVNGNTATCEFVGLQMQMERKK